MKIRFDRICKKDSQESAGETRKMDTDANQKMKKRRDQGKRKAEEILKNSTQQQPLFSAGFADESRPGDVSGISGAEMGKGGRTA